MRIRNIIIIAVVAAGITAAAGVNLAHGEGWCLVVQDIWKDTICR